MSQMDDDHRRDYENHAAMREMRRMILQFTDQYPARCHAETVLMLQKAARSLEADMALVVAVWD